jgi:hypothetical protein
MGGMGQGGGSEGGLGGGGGGGGRGVGGVGVGRLLRGRVIAIGTDACAQRGCPCLARNRSGPRGVPHHGWV